MANTGYLITIYQDVNPHSPTYNQTREERIYDTTSCPIPIQYRWVTVDGEYGCVGYDKYTVEKRQESIDGGTTWTDSVPSITRTGTLVETDSEYCGYVPPTIQYRWVTVEGEYGCVGYDKYTVEKRQESIDGGITWTDSVPSATRTGTLVEADSEYCGYVPPTPSYDKQYLTFEVVNGGTITFKASSAFISNTISYSLDNGDTWTKATSNTSAQSLGGTLSNGQKVLVKGNNASYATSSYYNSFGGTAKVNVYGNIMSLISGDNFVNSKTLNGSNIFYNLFKYYTNLLSAENLILPATTLANNCYSDMFYGCTSLTEAPELPATTLANNCYYNMFRGCTSLIEPPALPATTLANSCYFYMFCGCTSLRMVPELPATTLTDSCYYGMFYDCTSLRTVLKLPATTLAKNCYLAMFNGCTGLNYIKCLATDISASDCTLNWLNNVASNGTFVKDASMSGWTTGANGIPRGWTVINE